MPEGARCGYDGDSHTHAEVALMSGSRTCLRSTLLTALAIVGLLAAVPTRASGQTGGARAGAVPLVADASEIPAIEHDAAAPDLGSTLPRCLKCVTPAWPSPVTERWRFRLHLVLDTRGRVATARIVQTLVGDAAARPVGPMGDVAPALRSTPTARAGLAVLAAARQWLFEAPTPAPLLLVTDVGIPEDAPLSAAAPSVRAPVKVGGSITPPRKLVDVRPAYPADAIAARVTGLVTIEAVIGPAGDVVDTKVVSGVPMLDDAALAAVRQWRYTPTLVDGEPVAVIMTVTVNFSLGPAPPGTPPR